jgi:hypothetical protein
MFIEVVKENVDGDETRERIRQAIVRALPEEEGAGVGGPGDEVTQ